MKVDFTTQTSFQGYDARKLKGFIMSSNSFGIAEEMSKIGQKEGFKIFIPVYRKNKFACEEFNPKEIYDSANMWAQDLWTILKGKLLAFEYSKKTQAIKDFFNLNFDFTEYIAHTTDKIKTTNQNLWDLFEELRREPENKNASKKMQARKQELYELQEKSHIKGGNIFIVKGDYGDELLVGESELEKFSVYDMKAMYNVEKVTALPQMDFHLDLFIRPLDSKRILLADDNLTLEVLKNGLQKLVNFIYTLCPSEKVKYKNIFVNMCQTIKSFSDEISNNTHPNTSDVAKVLTENGYEVIKVPGRIYGTWGGCNETNLKHYCNYMNANVLKNDKDNLVYITNKSNIDKKMGLTKKLSDKIGFSFEKSFKDSISPYVKKDKIYFIQGKNDYVAREMLTEYQGGIHCASSEILEEINIGE